jgi:hypothetical protein
VAAERNVHEDGQVLIIGVFKGKTVNTALYYKDCGWRARRW